MAVFRLESDIEGHVADEAKRRWGLESLHITPRGDRGWPDRIFWVPGGKPLMIEFKRPGEAPEPLQQHVHSFLRRIGYHVQVHDNATLALEAIARAMAAAQVPGKGHQARPR